MSKLKEYKSDTLHYYSDEQERLQGELKTWWETGKLRVHACCQDGLYHGEYKKWNTTGTLLFHSFFLEDINITAEVNLVVQDIKNITTEERMIIKLKFGIKCLN